MLGPSQGFCARQGGAERGGRGGGHRGARGRARRQGLCRGGRRAVAAGGARRPAHGLRRRHGLAPGPARARTWVRPGGSRWRTLCSVARHHSLPPALLHRTPLPTPTVGVFPVGPRLRVPVPSSAVCRAQHFASLARGSENARRVGQWFPCDWNESWLTYLSIFVATTHARTFCLVSHITYSFSLQHLVRPRVWL